VFIAQGKKGGVRHICSSDLICWRDYTASPLSLILEKGWSPSQEQLEIFATNYANFREWEKKNSRQFAKFAAGFRICSQWGDYRKKVIIKKPDGFRRAFLSGSYTGDMQVG
jgi:hypothetical protein